MKTLKNLLLAVLLTGATSFYSQSLEISGKFRDNEGGKITASYRLISNGKVVSEGSATRLKQKLEMNQDYVLEVQKENMVTRTIRFSTHTTSHENFKFVFEVKLKKQYNRLQPGQEKNVVVYYDNKIGTFTYSRI